MEVSVRPITVTEELAAGTRERRCRAAPIESDADGDDRAGHGMVTLPCWRAMDGMYGVRLWISLHTSNRRKLSCRCRAPNRGASSIGVPCARYRSPNLT